LKHATRIAQHFIIPEPQNAKPLIFQPPRATLIAFTISVLTAVYLDN
jgi:hypothetical protein